MINIKRDEHIFICGKTGSGKTNLAKRLWRDVPQGHGIILDVKHELGEYGHIVHTIQDCHRILKNGRNVVFQGQNNQEIYSQIFGYVYNRGNTVLWIDEGGQVVPEGKICSEAVQLFTSGRSRGATAWTLTQRPAIVSKTAISQASHYFVYSLNLSHDKKAICSDIPISIEEFHKLQKYEYFYFCQGLENVEYCAPVSVQ